jgi:hypothetical protein
MNVSEEIQKLNSLNETQSKEGAMDIEEVAVNESTQIIDEKILTLKAILQLFTQILLEKTNERNMVYNLLNDRFMVETRNFFRNNISSKKGFDCKSYLLFAKKLRNLENEVFGRMFEDNTSMQFILDNLKRIFYEEVLLGYAGELIGSEFGFVWLIENRDFGVFKGIIFRR